MRKEIRIAGFGGQGIVLAGFLLGDAAIRDGKHAVQTQSYGPESRGGAARSEVVISNQTIDYPKVIKADILITLSQVAFNKYSQTVKKNGVIIVDSALVKSEKENINSVPFTKIADDLGKKIVANVVMLGYLVASTKVISIKSIESIIREEIPEHLIALNLKAFHKGIILWDK